MKGYILDKVKGIIFLSITINGIRRFTIKRILHIIFMPLDLPELLLCNLTMSAWNTVCPHHAWLPCYPIQLHRSDSYLPIAMPCSSVVIPNHFINRTKGLYSYAFPSLSTTPAVRKLNPIKFYPPSHPRESEYAST